MNKETKKEVVDILKKNGLDAAEEMAANAWNAACDIMIAVAPKVSFGLGSIMVPIIAVLRKPVLAIIDKIDGEDDPGR